MQNSKEERSYYRGDRDGRGENFNRRDGTARGERGSYGRRQEALENPDLRSSIISKDIKTPNADIVKSNSDRNDTLSTTKPEIPNGGTTIPDAFSEPKSAQAPFKKRLVKLYHNLNLHQLNWENYHSFECKHGCRNESSHYTKWREAYEEHLWDLYNVFTSERVNLSKINYNLFTVFVYNNSSRFISEFT